MRKPISELTGNKSLNHMASAIMAMVGNSATLTTIDGTQHQGILKIIDPLTGSASLFINGLVLNFLGKDIALMKTTVKRQFKTDVAISKNHVTKERTLEKWTPDSNVPYVELDGNADWDQFDVNQKLFGVQTDYNELIYTTKVDRSAPDFKKREAEAERLAREIEKAPAFNAHILEERGIATAGDVDEEEKYSSVARKEKKAAKRESPPATEKNDPKVKLRAPDVTESFKKFAVIEKQKILQQKDAIIDGFKRFSDSLKLPKPPSDSKDFFSRSSESAVDASKSGEKSPEVKASAKPEELKPAGKKANQEPAKKADAQIVKAEKIESKPTVSNAPPVGETAPAPEPPKKAFSFNAKAAEFTPSFIDDSKSGANGKETPNQYPGVDAQYPYPGYPPYGYRFVVGGPYRPGAPAPHYVPMYPQMAPGRPPVFPPGGVMYPPEMMGYPVMMGWDGNQGTEQPEEYEETPKEQ